MAIANTWLDSTLYALLAGREGGQTLYGGNEANDNLTLEPTAHATKTTAYLRLAAAGGTVVIGATGSGKNALRFSNTVASVDNAYGIYMGPPFVLAPANNYGAYFQCAGGGTVDTGVSNTVVNSSALYAERIYKAGGGTITNTYGLNCFTSTVGTNNYAAYFEKRVGIGTAAPSHQLTVVGSDDRTQFAVSGFTTQTSAVGYFARNDGNTNAVKVMLQLDCKTTGTAAAGFGTSLEMLLEDAAGTSRNAGTVKVLWYEAAGGTRKADLVLTAYDTVEREGLRIRGNGSAPTLGVLGATPIARIAHVADPTGGATVDAEARSAINSILATLEGFGFHAAS